MKRLFGSLVGLAVVALLAGCPATMQTNVSPGQQLVNTTAKTCDQITATIVATDQAVLAGVLKGNDARNAVKALGAAQAGCVAALVPIQAANAAPPTPAASGVPK